MEGVTVEFAPDGYRMQCSRGSAGLRSHAAGCAATVSGLAAASGGIGNGGIIEADRC